MNQELESTFDPFWGKTAGSLMVQSHRFSHPHGLFEICLLWNTLINWLKFKRLVIKSVDLQLEHKWNKHRILQAEGLFPSFAFWSRTEGLWSWSPQTGVCLANITLFSSTIFFRQKEKNVNQQQKQPTQETTFQIHYSRNSEKKKKKGKTRNTANTEFFNMPHCSLGKFPFTESHLCY